MRNPNQRKRDGLCPRSNQYAFTWNLNIYGVTIQCVIYWTKEHGIMTTGL